MTFSAVKKIQSEDRVLNQVQGVLTAAINRMSASPVIDGRLLENIQVTSRPKQFSHGLGRIPVGAIVSSQSGIGSIYFADADDKFISIANALTTPTTYTPTGTWASNCTYSGNWKRVGDSLYAVVTISLTGSPIGTMTVNIPTGFSIDSVAILGSSRAVVGNAMAIISSTSFNGLCYVNNSTSVKTSWPYHARATAGTAFSEARDGNATSPQTASGNTFANGDLVSISFVVPIASWDNAQTESSSISADIWVY